MENTTTQEKDKKPITYHLDGKEYQDKLIITTKLEISFWKKLKSLFKPLFVIEHHLYLEQKAPIKMGTQYGYKFMTKEQYKKMNEKK